MVGRGSPLIRIFGHVGNINSFRGDIFDRNLINRKVLNNQAAFDELESETYLRNLQVSDIDIPMYGFKTTEGIQAADYPAAARNQTLPPPPPYRDLYCPFPTSRHPTLLHSSGQSLG